MPGRLRRRRAVGTLAAVIGLAAGAGVGGCGADAVSVEQEAQVLVATCRSFRERAHRTDGAPVRAEEFERFLRHHPGGADDPVVVRFLKARCSERRGTNGR